MTINEIISFVGTNRLRKADKDTEILEGINHVKNQLLSHKLRRQYTIASGSSIITLVANQYDDYDLPSDCGIIDELWLNITTDNKYPLAKAYKASEITEDTTGGYPYKYFPYGDNKVMIGALTPNYAFTVTPHYYATVSDYTTGTTTPILADIYGSELYIYGAEAFVWDCIEQYDKAEGIRLKRYEPELRRILNIEAEKAPNIVKPNPLF